MECACGCGNSTSIAKRTFLPGHNRRAHGRLLTQLAANQHLDHDLLAAYTGTLTKRPEIIAVDDRLGYCLCGCGKTTYSVFAAGHGNRFTDGLLRHAAGEQVRFTIPVLDALTLWRERQRISPGARRRAARHG
jgi:hypothetical protein